MRFLKIFGPLTLMLGVNACFDDDKNTAPAMPPTQVSVVSVQPQDVPLSFEYSGRTSGSREVEVRARVNGIIMKRRYVEGQKVKAGQVLFEIDPEIYRADLEQSQGLLENERALLSRAKADYERVRKLYEEKAISGREFDEARAAFLQAQAGVTQANAGVRSSKINVNYTRVQAPISGVTSKENRSEGSYIQANSENSLLTRITQLDPLYVNFAFPDTDALQQRSGLASGKVTLKNKVEVEILSADGSVLPQKGIVNFTDSFVDPATGSVSARATVPNKDGNLLPGQFVRVRVVGFVRPNTMAIPAKAVMQGPQGMFVYVVTAEGKAAIRPVKIGPLTPVGQIVEEGLQPGERVIAEGVIKVRPDAPVQVVDPNAVPANAKGDPDAGKAAGVSEMSGNEKPEAGRNRDQDTDAAEGKDQSEDQDDQDSSSGGSPKADR